MLDRTTGDLVWFAAGARHSRPHASAPGEGRLVLADDQPAVLDPARRTAELLDPATGNVERSAPMDLAPDDNAAVSGSPDQHRLLVSVSPKGVLMVCEFSAESCATPLSFGHTGLDLGPAVEAGNHAVVPDYASGRVWIVDLTEMRIVVERQLFDRPTRFELLVRDGVVFFNDPDSERAGVLELDGRIRAINKYDPANPGATPSVTDTGSGSQPSGVAPASTGGSPGSTAVSIVVRPGHRGTVGEELEFAVVASGTAGVSSARWTFGDGAETTGTTVRHRWRAPGTYSVRATATLTTGQRAPVASVGVIIESPDAPPEIARLKVDPANPRIGQVVRFSADLVGRRPDGRQWTVTGGQGVETTSSAPELHHVFRAAGSYTVALVVTAGSFTAQRTAQFEVEPEPREVRCGDIITAHATLKRDLVCPENVALRIAADNVELNLDGHTITTGKPAESNTGIIAVGKNITIRNGMITGFDVGIGMPGVENVTISNLTVADAHDFDITADRARNVQLRTVTLSDSSSPLAFDHGSSVRITGSNISGKDGGGTMGCSHDSSCVIVNSYLRLEKISCINEEPASEVVIDNTDLTMDQIGYPCKFVTLKNSPRVRISIVSATHLTVEKSSFQQSTSMSGLSFSISNSEFSNTEWTGLSLFCGFCLDSQLVRNKFINNNWTGLDIHILDTDGKSIVISDNVFTGNGHRWQGSPVGPGNGFDLLRDADADPIADVIVSNNHASDNAQYGIIVYPGSNVINGGRNTTSGDPLECKGIECEPGR
ncbi:PKD repeat protein [Kibdelosporangium banguiense]|uniref:PKD repeat protein n=1 Tax=Kibdelosporangium banguiense TaxID=1365924 RepID=A0ABS4TYQ3_9PSEU|nr:PKD domain-containing protein [Kibdelosporangium banguiense]MBP2329532.1 PKD repeat protein [Kibdelosporangium banguiense]